MTASSMEMRAAPPVVAGSCLPPAAFASPIGGADPISLAIQGMPAGEAGLKSREAADQQRGGELGARSGVTHAHVSEKDAVESKSVESTTRYI